MSKLFTPISMAFSFIYKIYIYTWAIQRKLSRHDRNKMPWYLSDTNEKESFITRVLQPKRKNAQLLCKHLSHQVYHGIAVTGLTVLRGIVHLYICIYSICKSNQRGFHQTHQASGLQERSLHMGCSLHIHPVPHNQLDGDKQHSSST